MRVAPEAQRGHQRRRQADAAVAVPVVPQAHRREEHRQRRGGHDVVDRDPGVEAAVPRLVQGWRPCPWTQVTVCPVE